ncbi:MAG: riboflavin synthase [Candidatus Gracilibacteria bacterium]|nr:riboflavin synthase [Candidatus Gracilibacteria bacterium]
MFSGIIEHQAKILDKKDGLFRMENTFGNSLKEGQSIAHDGACMTLTKIENNYYEFFAMEETLRVTNFGTKKVNDTFNVERCIQIGERLDGHFVTGHIDTTGTVTRLEKKDDGSLIYGVNFDPKYNNLLIEKGSITLNGVSLTVVEVRDGFLSVSLIPLTQDWTNLGTSEIGDTVNLEFDMIGKYVTKLTHK